MGDKRRPYAAVSEYELSRRSWLVAPRTARPEPSVLGGAVRS